MTDSQRFDVLVLGSGIAGLFYALRVADTARVAIVTKKQAADSATNWAQGGIAAVHAEEDSFEAHAEDTLVAGAGLCHPEVVRRVVERGPVMIDARAADAPILTGSTDLTYGNVIANTQLIPRVTDSVIGKL